MHTRRAIVCSMMAAGLSLTLLGCGGGGARSDAEATRDLKAIGLAYHNFNDQSGGRAPKDAEDLKKFVEMDSKTAYPGLKDGRYIFIWNVRLLDMSPTSDYILAYEKDVPTKGGPVLYGDATVKDLTAEEFKAAKKAQPKN